jgi:alpha-tubulin suppressor-like RCC1 family protein
MNMERPPAAFALRAVVATVAMGAAVSACRSPTEIVLVIDTNLTTFDIDTVAVTITGSQTQTIDVGLTAPGAPAFPLTLGLEPAGAAGPVEVSVVGSLQGNPVVQQEADTAFVEGSVKLLRMLLLDSCIGASCPVTPTAETCNAGACTSAATPGGSLPPWTGVLPARPSAATTTPIDGRTIWSDGWHSCANEGTILYCWGQNSDGEIGDGSQRNANSRKPVMNIASPSAVGLGEFVTCICDRTGQAWCWGRNVEGELGIGSASANSKLPVQVPGVTDCVQIAGGGEHTCVVHADGTVSCWGSNASGQVGQAAAATPLLCAESMGAAVPCITSPVKVPGLTNVVEVQAGEQYTCARKTDLTVSCWGDNSSGQLGDGTKTSRSTPAVIAGLATDVVGISAGRFFACARHATGHVSCWGSNSSGQLGNGNTTSTDLPVDVGAIADATQLATGLLHTCALRSSGIVSCWGGNSAGQLGNGTTTDSLVPVDVIGLMETVTSIAAGSVHTCARAASGLASCWGENIVNQIGDGTTTNRSQPVSVAGFM